MKPATGSITILHDNLYYTLVASGQSWNVEGLVEYLDDIYAAADRTRALLRILGYTMRITRDKPPRNRNQSWVEIDLDRHLLETNSELIRRAVDQEPEDPSRPFDHPVQRRIYDVLDRHDFTVKIF